MKRLMRKIKAEMKARVASIMREAAREEERILADAKKRARAERAKILEEAKKKAETEKQRIIAEARLKARKERVATLDRLLEEAIGQALNDLNSIRKYRQYASILNKVTKQAIEEIPSNKVNVLVSKRDKTKLRLGKIKGKKIRIVNGNLQAGTIVEASDKSVSISNDFAELVKERKQEIKRELVRRFFS